MWIFHKTYFCPSSCSFPPFQCFMVTELTNDIYSQPPWIPWRNSPDPVSSLTKTVTQSTEWYMVSLPVGFKFKHHQNICYFSKHAIICIKATFLEAKQIFPHPSLLLHATYFPLLPETSYIKSSFLYAILLVLNSWFQFKHSNSFNQKHVFWTILPLIQMCNESFS